MYLLRNLNPDENVQNIQSTAFEVYFCFTFIAILTFSLNPNKAYIVVQFGTKCSPNSEELWV
jgi:hypothetical protein